MEVKKEMGKNQQMNNEQGTREKGKGKRENNCDPSCIE